MGIPKRKGHHLISLWIWLLTLFAFRVFGAAVFAEPTITNIEEVIGLIQGQRVCDSAGLKTQTGTFAFIACGSRVSYPVPE